METKKLSIIIPVYNEADSVQEVIRGVAKLRISKEIICVDDCSTDGTLKKLRKLKKDFKFRLVTRKKNGGKGVAVRSGLKRAQGIYSLIYDADLEYPAKNISFLMKEMRKIRAGWPDPEEEISLYGSRFMENYREKLSLHYFANRFLTVLTNLLFNSNLTDMETCLKICPTEILKSFHLSARRFEIEPELTAKLLKRGVLIIDRPIQYRGRKKNKEKISFKNGLSAIKTIFKERFRVD